VSQPLCHTEARLSQTPSDSIANTGALPPIASFSPESVWSITLRRARYFTAIVISGAIFWTVGWAFAAPPPQFAGISLLAWAPAAGLIGAILLTILLFVCITISMLITHPDAPHTGLYCALLGLAGLAIRGGGIFMLLDTHEFTRGLPAVFSMLAAECGVWAIILIFAEVFSRLIYASFFANTAWIGRSGVDPARFDRRLGARGLYAAFGDIARARIESGMDRKPVPPMLANAGAFLISAATAAILLALFMKSQEKGQVLFAAFLSFGLAGFLANFAFPDSSPWPIWLSIPIVATVGYLVAPVNLPFPGHAASAMSCALPIDYLSAGIPGAILGYYTSLRLRFHNAAAEADAAIG